MERFAAQGPRPGNERMTASAKSAVVDFLFTGVGVVPVALIIGGWPGLALMLACPLLFGACLYALYAEDPAIDGGDGRADRIGCEGDRQQNDDHLLRALSLDGRCPSVDAHAFVVAFAPAFLMRNGPSVEQARRTTVPALLRPREAAHAPAVDESPAAAWLVPLDGMPESMAAIEGRSS